MSGQWICRARPYFISLLFTLVFYSPFLSPQGHLLPLGDYPDFHMPIRDYANRALRAGHLPEWERELFGGFPFLSDPQTAVFYPPNLALAVLTDKPDTSAVMDRLIFFHIILLSLGAVFLARSLGLGSFGAVTTSLGMSFNGFIILHLSHINIIETLAVGLWAIGCLARAMRSDNRRAAIQWGGGAAMLFSVAILAGYPQVNLYLYYVAAIGGCALVAGRSSNRIFGGWAGGWILCAGVLALGFAGAALHTLPVMYLLSNSDRKYLDLNAALAYSFPPSQIAGLFFPNLYVLPTWWAPSAVRSNPHVAVWGADLSGEYLYQVGAALSVLALLGWFANFKRWRVQFLFWTSVFLVLCSFGGSTPLYPLLFKYAPGFAHIRIPTRLMCIAVPAWSLLAGLGADAVARETGSRAMRWASVVTALVTSALAALGIAIILRNHQHGATWIGTFNSLFVKSSSGLPGEVSQHDFAVSIWGQLTLATVVVLAALTVLILRVGKPQWGRKLAVAYVALVFLELCVYGFSRNIIFGPGLTRNNNALLDCLPLPPRGRVLGIGAQPYFGIDVALSRQIPYAGGYNAFNLEWIPPFLPPPSYSLGREQQDRILDMWNVSDLVFRPKHFASRIGGIGLQLPDARWVEIAKDTADLGTTLTWRLPLGQRVKRVHVVCAVTAAMAFPDGTEAARLRLAGTDGTILASFPIQLGKHVSEWDYDCAPEDYRGSHAKAEVAHAIPLNPGICNKGVFYDAAFELPDPATVSRATIEISLPLPASLCVSHIIFDNGVRPDIRTGLEGLGYLHVESRDPAWQILERPSAPGFAWMVPEAQGASWQDNMNDVKEKVLSAAFDPRKQVVVSTDDLEMAVSANINAITTETFSGQATIEPNTPESFTIKTHSNDRGWLVIAQTYFPSWLAQIDGREAHLLRANGAHCALPISAGDHRIEMHYETGWLKEGAALSAIAWLTALAMLVIPAFRPRQRTVL